MDDNHIFNQETDSEMLAMEIVKFLQKWGMWQDVQIFAGGKCYKDDKGKLVVRNEEHPEKYLEGPIEDCNGEITWEEFSNPERLLDMTFEGPFSLLLCYHEYEVNMGEVSEEVRRILLPETNEVADEVAGYVDDFLEGKIGWDPAEYDSYEEWLELNGFDDMEKTSATMDEIGINPIEISSQEEYREFLDKCEVIREQKIWDYFEDYFSESSEYEDTAFFDDGRIAGMVLNEFDELLAGYGLWYELGFSWSLTTYRK
ncbi:MAG: hypothetical protein ACI4DU_06100 [Lachnospiraceae bacterium]